MDLHPPDQFWAKFGLDLNNPLIPKEKIRPDHGAIPRSLDKNRARVGQQVIKMGESMLLSFCRRQIRLELAQETKNHNSFISSMH